jgi:hypothetical protein
VILHVSDDPRGHQNFVKAELRMAEPIYKEHKRTVQSKTETKMDFSLRPLLFLTLLPPFNVTYESEARARRNSQFACGYARAEVSLVTAIFYFFDAIL